MTQEKLDEIIKELRPVIIDSEYYKWDVTLKAIRDVLERHVI